jgi:hypothetical protein
LSAKSVPHRATAMMTLPGPGRSRCESQPSAIL